MHPWDSCVGGQGVLELCAEWQTHIAARGHHPPRVRRRPACPDDPVSLEALIGPGSAELRTPSFLAVLPLCQLSAVSSHVGTRSDPPLTQPLVSNVSDELATLVVC
eukprot:COSAG02_NODE_1546_length_11977_cov_3.458586_8_plen_106_part_00